MDAIKKSSSSKRPRDLQGRFMPSRGEVQMGPQLGTQAGRLARAADSAGVNTQPTGSGASDQCHRSWEAVDVNDVHGATETPNGSVTAAPSGPVT